MRSDKFGPVRLNRFASREDFIGSFETSVSQLSLQQQFQTILVQLMQSEAFWFECSACGSANPMELTGNAQAPIDWRETALCPKCHLNSRQRFAMQRLRARVTADDARAVYLTEQASWFYALAKRTFTRVIGSEFVLDRERRRLLADYTRRITEDPNENLIHADVTRLSIASASLAAIGCFDVLEHVPDYAAALNEFARVLAPGGSLLLTLPFLPDQPATKVLAAMAADGAITHYGPPEYHGDPGNGGGVLCFYHFGWDLIDKLRALGFSDVHYVTSWSMAHGLFDQVEAIEATR